MTAPPIYTARPDEPAVCATPDAYLALLIREARTLDPALREIGKSKLLRMAREFAVAHALDLRDRQAREASAEEFGNWLQRRGDIIRMRSKPRAADPRWRVTS